MIIAICSPSIADGGTGIVFFVLADLGAFVVSVFCGFWEFRLGWLPRLFVAQYWVASRLLASVVFGLWFFFSILGFCGFLAFVEFCISWLL